MGGADALQPLHGALVTMLAALERQPNVGHG
jgi:hypothetical protein